VQHVVQSSCAQLRPSGSSSLTTGSAAHSAGLGSQSFVGSLSQVPQSSTPYRVCSRNHTFDYDSDLLSDDLYSGVGLYTAYPAP